MKAIFLALFLGVFCLFVSTPFAALAQKSRASFPVEIDRDGLRQWAKVDEACKPCEGEGKRTCEGCKGKGSKSCAECKGKDAATCRSCGGGGKVYDALKDMICPYCDGSALWQCPACDGKGDYGVEGGGKGKQRCGPCKAKGHLKCEVCKGKRRIPVLKATGQNPGSVSAASLKKTREALSEAVELLRFMEPSGSEADNAKALDEALKKASKILPATKGLKKMVSVSMKALRGQAEYVGYEGWIASEFNTFRDVTIAYIKSQYVIIDACEERLKFNAAVRAKK